MEFRVGNYIVKAHELDNKISLNITTDVQGTVKLKEINEFISYDKKVVYEIEGYHGKFYHEQLSKAFGEYILSFEQTIDGKLEIWYTKLDKFNQAFVSRKKINGESLTIALRKEIQ